MDQEERDRREEVERKEQALRDHIDKSTRDERDEREKEDKVLRDKIGDEVRRLYVRVEDVEEKLEKRDREIENESRDRDSAHDTEISGLKQSLKLHVEDEKIHAEISGLKQLLKDHIANERIHKRLHTTETLQGMQVPVWAVDRNAPSGQHAVPAAEPEAPGLQVVKGAPWYLQPKWLLGIAAAIVALGAAAAGIVKMVLDWLGPVTQ